MDVFSRTFLPAAADAGLAAPTMSRHLPVFRQCVPAADATILVTRCTRPDAPGSGEHLLLLTRRRLVVTQQSRVLRRLRLHLNTELRHLNDVTWNCDPRLPLVEFAATAVDGVRERYLIRIGRLLSVRQVDALLIHLFRPPTVPAVPEPAAAPEPAAPAVVPAVREHRRPVLSPAVAV